MQAGAASTIGTSGQAHIKQSKPILNGLQSKSAKNESDAEDAQPSFRKVVCVVFNVGIHRRSNAGDKASHKPYTQRKRPDVFDMPHESTTDQRRGNVADSPHDRAPELT